MKKKSIWVSLLIGGIIGILLLAGLLYLEKQDKKKAIAKDEKEQMIQTEKKLDNSGQQENASINQSESDIVGEIQIETEEVGSDVSLLFTGDVLLSRHILSNYESQGIDGILSESLHNEMNQADILMVNQEFPFGTTGEKAEDKEYTFRVEPTHVGILKEMGTDIVSLANNHVLDYGTNALEETFQTLNEAGILYGGAGDSVERAKQMQTVEAAGETYGFIAASRVIPVESWNIENSVPGVFTTYSSGAIVSAIEEAKKTCDFLTVYVHWGIERSTTPEDYQVSLAHEYIDAGADLVIGSHPHVLQGIEFYQGKPIFYSLGNFIFNQSIEKTMLVKIERETGDTKVSVIPAYAEGAKTTEIEEASREDFYRYLESLSQGVTIRDGIVESGS